MGQFQLCGWCHKRPVEVTFQKSGVQLNLCKPCKDSIKAEIALPAEPETQPVALTATA